MTGVETAVTKLGLLRDPKFDGLLIVGTLSLALLLYAVVTSQPALYWPILTLNLWLFGYHHVIATYTRIASDTQTIREYRFLVFVLPVLVLGAVVAILNVFGAVAIASIYLYWQWWHYLRQSEGISKAYLGKSGLGPLGSDLFLRGAFYGIPLASFLTMVDRQPGVFLNMRIWTFPIPDLLLQGLWAAAIGAGMMFVWKSRKNWRKGSFKLAYPLYLISHFSIFIIAYAVSENLDNGWLALNVWHNTQYLLFVWLFNQKRYQSGVQKKGWLLSFISQPGRAWLYFAVLFTITTIFYFLINQIIYFVEAGYAVSLTIIAYQTINFHHYIVDSLIWKLRKKPLRRTLGIEPS